MDERTLKEAIFVFLHGVQAFSAGEWEPILLSVLHGAGFEATELRYEKHLELDQYESSSIDDPNLIGLHLDSHRISQRIPFGVIVLVGDRWNEDAIHWLNETAMRIPSMRESEIEMRITHGKKAFDQLTNQETRDLQEHLRKRLSRLPLFSDGVGEPVNMFEDDPRSFAEYEAQLTDHREELAKFTEFLDVSVRWLLNELSIIKPFEPILLSEFGDVFMQESLSGMYRKRLRDDMELQHGIHGPLCGGGISFLPLTDMNQAMICNRCHMRVVLSRSTIRTFAQLRYRGEQFRNR